MGGGLASHGEHHPSRDSGDDAGRLVVIGHPGPRRRLGQVMPTGPSQPQQGDVLGLAGLEGVPVHRRGEGVGGINHRSDVLGAQEGAQPVHPAETADPHLAGESGRCRGASGDGGDDVHLLLDEPGGQFPGQTGAPQNQDVHVAHLPSIHDWPWLDWPSTIWPGSIGTEQHCRGQTSAWAVMCPRLSRGQGSHAFRDLMCKDRSRGAVEHRCESGTVPPL